jgi:hypothetical protein
MLIPNPFNVRSVQLKCWLHTALYIIATTISNGYHDPGSTQYMHYVFQAFGCNALRTQCNGRRSRAYAETLRFSMTSFWSSGVACIKAKQVRIPTLTAERGNRYREARPASQGRVYVHFICFFKSIPFLGSFSIYLHIGIHNFVFENTSYYAVSRS